jgi:hypothetical protein
MINGGFMSPEGTTNAWNKGQINPYKSNDTEVELKPLSASKEETKEKYVQSTFKNMQHLDKKAPINEPPKTSQADNEGLSRQSLNALAQISRVLKIEEGGDENILLAKYGFLQYYLNNYEKGLKTTFNLISFVAYKFCPSLFGYSPINEAIHANNRIATDYPKIARSFESQKAYSLNINEIIVRKNLDYFLLKLK